jgi:hypothetical protein
MWVVANNTDNGTFSVSGDNAFVYYCISNAKHAREK